MKMFERSKKAWKKTAGEESQWQNRDYLDYSIIKNDKNTPKNPEYQRKIAVTQSPVKKQQ